MSIYLITCREMGAVKIGRSHNPHKRFDQIKTGCPLPVKLEAILPGSTAVELQMHRRFADTRLQGEWFKITPEIEALIKANPASPPAPKQAQEVSPFAAARLAGAAADFERKIAAIRKAEAEGRIRIWVSPSANNGANFLGGGR